MSIVSKNKEPSVTPDKARLQRWSKLLSQFVSGQASIQLINLVTGFLLLHWLSIKDYAQYSVAFAFQNTLNGLVDLGFSGSIVALVGERKTDPGVIGSYIRAAKGLRTRFSIIGISVSCILFPYLTWRQGWSVTTTLLLLASIIAAVLLQNRMIYAAPLLIHSHLKPFYQSQIISAGSRLALVLLLRPINALVAGTAAISATMATGISGFLYHRNALPLIKEPETSEQQINREMFSYLAPLMPTVIFNALQGQVVMALVTWFGKTNNIAEVAALGRLNQLFIVLAAFNAVIIEPYIASVPASKLTKRYIQIVILSVGVAAFLSTLGINFPNAFVWLLGKNYAHLQLECSWSIASSSLYYVASVILTMNCARKWISWRITFMEISSLIVLDILCIRILNLSETLGIIQLSFITVVGFIVVHTVNGVWGLTKNDKQNTTLG